MKTTDLIPILLYQLKDGDKYGLELINSCNDCSDGKITIKQPTLYSILKKLEKSKFISSYWQDSNIGGKRHYFKITENGLSQLETYPPLKDLIDMALTDSEEEIIEVKEQTEVKEEKSHSPSPFDNFSMKKSSSSAQESVNVFDKLFVKEKPETIEENNIKEPVVEDIKEDDNTSADVLKNSNILEENEAIFKETVNEIESEEQPKPMPSFSVFDALDFADSEDIDEEQSSTPVETNLELENPFYKETKEKTLEEKTSLEINEENTKLISNNTQVDEFVSNKKVAKFTEKNILPSDSHNKEIAVMFSEEVKPSLPTTFEVEENIKYQDYIDIKNDKNVRAIYKTSNKRLYKVAVSSILSILCIFACFIGALKNGFSAIFTVFSIVSTLYVVYYFCNFVGKFKEHRYSIGENFNYNFKKSFIVRISIFAVLLLIVVVYNLINKFNIFKMSNFANFLAPIIISSLILIDYLFALTFYRKK